MTTTETAGTGGVQGEAAAARSGLQIDTLDKPADYDPDVLGAYGLEYDGPRCAGDDCRTPVENDGDRCEDCAGRCTECGREVSRPGCCFDCQVEGSYVGGLAPRFGAQP